MTGGMLGLFGSPIAFGYLRLLGLFCLKGRFGDDAHHMDELLYLEDRELIWHLAK